jgi:hypothetical protein
VGKAGDTASRSRYLPAAVCVIHMDVVPKQQSLNGASFQSSNCQHLHITRSFDCFFFFFMGLSLACNSLRSPGWPRTHNISVSTCEWWDYRCALPYSSLFGLILKQMANLQILLAQSLDISKATLEMFILSMPSLHLSCLSVPHTALLVFLISLLPNTQTRMFQASLHHLPLPPHAMYIHFSLILIFC